MKAAEIFEPRFDDVAGYLGGTCRWCGVWFDAITDYQGHADYHVTQGDLERYLTISGPEFRPVFGRVPPCAPADLLLWPEDDGDGW